MTTESESERLLALLNSIKHNAAIMAKAAADCGEAYKERQVPSRHYAGNLLADIPRSAQWIWTAFSDAVERTANSTACTNENIAQLADRTIGIAATARVLIAYLSESEHFMPEPPLNRLIGDLDGLHRTTDWLLDELRQEQDNA